LIFIGLILKYETISKLKFTFKLDFFQILE